jgi:hypothetical protein
MNAFGFTKGSSLYGRDREFCRYTLYSRSGKPNVSREGKGLWLNYLALGMGASNSITAVTGLLAELGYSERDTENVIAKIESYASQHKIAYLDLLRQKIEAYVHRDWAFGPFDQDLVEQLKVLQPTIDKSDEDNEKYEEILNRLTTQYSSEAKDTLESVLAG